MAKNKVEYEKSAGAIIYYKHGRQTRYLILHYGAGHWDFPKGNVEKNEADETAAKREVEEESGLTKIRFEKGFKEKIHYFYKKNNKLISKSVVFYLAKSSTKKVRLSFEHIGYEWLDYKKALERVTHKTARDLLKKASNFLK